VAALTVRPFFEVLTRLTGRGSASAATLAFVIDGQEAQPMDGQARPWTPERVVVIAALALGVAAGTYGIASAANGSGSGSSQSSALSSGGWPVASGSQSGPSAGQPWGRQRSDETPLTGDALSKLTAAAEARVPGGTIIRVETDADGSSAYEAHMVKADGTPVTVYVSKQFDVVSVESGMPGRPGRAPSQPSGGASA
jgi:hypothetical protein